CHALDCFSALYLPWLAIDADRAALNVTHHQWPESTPYIPCSPASGFNQIDEIFAQPDNYTDARPS
ncbi:MAG: hypothetical protein VW524_09320, partial [Halieaceae bacterium]